jgi:hypothetical protein
MLKRTACCLMLLAMTAQFSWAVGKDKAKFMGGTSAAIPPKTEGIVDVSDPENMVFMGEKGGSLRIPWKSVQSIEYGQNVSRRWKTAIFISPIALLSKARKHMITITYKEKSQGDQAVVLEFGKDIYRLALASLKAKSGRDITCQDEEAKKQFGGGCTVTAASEGK